MALRASACHFVRLNRCICQPAVGDCSAPCLQTVGGGLGWVGGGVVLAVELRWRVNQPASQTASCVPAAVWGPLLVSSRAVIPNSFHLLPLLLPKSLLCHRVFSEKPLLIDFCFFMHKQHNLERINVSLFGKFLTSTCFGKTPDLKETDYQCKICRFVS